MFQTCLSSLNNIKFVWISRHKRIKINLRRLWSWCDEIHVQNGKIIFILNIFFIYWTKKLVTSISLIIFNVSHYTQWFLKVHKSLHHHHHHLHHTTYIVNEKKQKQKRFTTKDVVVSSFLKQLPMTNDSLEIANKYQKWETISLLEY